ncbi:hypothetical protein LOC71_05405 [Rhodopirellula sp. JC740]|uniref:Uncharacterized protein n=1 Tax=Rhodopirellula halodulae TaxID=2894198 RepID=A0ABS8NDR6_9BACT|nr:MULTISPECIES: hypothetical protein [unclassified Rhodopirellula]MCC9641702.1 hypothetical protein [Rhodopirellula sp. JC740]MCC9654694.1 hypothetical protein [Rhodopirellula sp. JC737]
MPTTAKTSSKASAATKKAGDEVVTIDRRRSERRAGDATASDAGMMDQPRRKKQRRRHIDPTTCERDYSEQEVEFMKAMDDYKRDSGRMFPTCSEVLEVLRSLNYVQLSDDQFEELGLVDAPESEESWSDEEADELAEV